MEGKIEHIHRPIIEASKTGDRKAQHQLYSLYAKGMFAICMRMLNKREDAEDVLQESFIKAFKNIESFRYESTYGAWLKRIVINSCINHLKKQRMYFDDLEDHDYHLSDSVEEEQQSSFDIAQVKKGIQALPEGYRVVLSLYLLEGYDHIEIGEILGISSGTSKSQYSRAKKKLKELLKN